MAHDSESGAVDREVVLRVLKGHKVDAAPAADPEVTNLYKEGVAPEAQRLPATVPKKLLHRFSAKYGIPIHHFYHPELAPKPS